MNFYNYFYNNVEKQPEKIAVIDRSEEYSYEELDQLICKYAGIFVNMGVEKGDRVAMAIGNTTDFITTFYALAKIGVVIILANVNFTAQEVYNMYKDFPFKAAIVDDNLLNNYKQLKQHLVDMLSTSEIKSKKNVASLNKVVDIKPDSIFTYQVSSGTTGVPKGVLRTIDQVYQENLNLNNTAKFEENEIVFLLCPAYHEYGFIGGIISPLLSGATTMLMGKFMPNAALRMIEKHKVSRLIAVPFMYGLLLKAPISKLQIESLGKIKYLFCSGDKLPEQIEDGFREKFCANLRQFYGSSESGAIAIDIDKKNENSKRSLPKPIDNVKIEIIDNNGNVLPSMETGEIKVISKSVFVKYNNNEEETNQCKQDGGYLTGDRGFLDESGRLHFQGRKKDIIITAGINVNPTEVENVLRGHAAVDDVAVYGMEDALIGEYIEAAVVVNEEIEIENLIEYCKTNMAHFKVPRNIKKVDVIPRTSSGKIKRYLLKIK